MKKLLLIVATAISLGVVPAFAQLGMGDGRQGPEFDAALRKIFGANQSFSAIMEVHTTMSDGQDLTMPGRYSFDGGKTRFEMNMADMKGAMFTPTTVQRMKALGMDITIVIGRPDLKVSYLIYPSLTSYAESAQAVSPGSASPDDYKIESTDAGRETVDGHDCTKSMVTLTDKQNSKFEFTVWDATDLKNFPIKIETTTGGLAVTMKFKNISFTKPTASQFDAPSGYTKYNSRQALMQAEMAKRAAGGIQPSQ